MKFLVFLLATICAALAAVTDRPTLVQTVQGIPELIKAEFDTDKLVSDWQQFKKTYTKNYKTTEEELSRFKIFLTHTWKIQKHNTEEAATGEHGFWTGMNKFGDMTNEEFRQKYNTYKYAKKVPGIKWLEPSFTAVPAAIDWRDSGYVTPVKDQGQCGSCWAFSTTGSLEGQHFKSTGDLVSLSEQNLVDCSGSEGNEGCNGGLMDYAFEYIKKKGIDTEASYPYTAEDGTCKYKKKNVGATCTGYVDVTSGSETALKKAVGTVGPISVAIDASNWSFQMYKSGIYNEKSCSSTNLDHGVLAVGYNSTATKDNKKSSGDYWIVKNSWNADWGMKGYIWMSRNKNNQCGIATAASYPTV